MGLKTKRVSKVSLKKSAEKLPKHKVVVPRVAKRGVHKPTRVLNEYTGIRCPLSNENAMKKIEEQNVLTFMVDTKANKKQVKQFVEKLYDVKVEKVRTLNTPRAQKKAYVKLHKDFDAMEVASKIGMV